ncbi:MAG: hypothetical protein PVF85_04045, partial [Anaerolineales bacterium]
MSEVQQERPLKRGRRLPVWLSAILPLIALSGMLAFFILGNPLALFSQNLPPVEVLNFERVQVIDDGI